MSYPGAMRNSRTIRKLRNSKSGSRTTRDSRTALSGAFLLAIAVALWAPGARAESIEIAAARDGTLFEDESGSLASGAGPALFAGNTNGAGTRRALLWFDLPGQLVGADILDVELTLTVDRSGMDAVERTFSLHRLSADWGTGDSDSGQSGGGVAAAPGDATWRHRFSPGSEWGNRGGDFDPVVSAAAGVGGVGGYVFGSAGLVADVQAWANGVANYGWILLGDETTFQTARRFASSEKTAGGGPRLHVDYAPGVPEPSAAALALVAALLAAGRALGRG